MPTMRYKTTKGRQVPSVTTVIGRFKESGALIYWANHLAIDVLKESKLLLEDIQGILSVPTGDYVDPDLYFQKWQKIVNFLSSNPLDRADAKKYVKEAATAGTACHDLVENWLLAVKTLPDRTAYQSPSIQQIQQQSKISEKLATLAHTSFQAFLSWVDKTSFQIVETEMPLVSDYYKFGGCPDCLSKTILNPDINYEQLKPQYRSFGPTFYDLFDWKTSGRIYPDYLIQIAAYRLLIEEESYCRHCFSSPEDYHESRYYYDSDDGYVHQPNHDLGYEYRGNPSCQTCYGLGTTKPIANVHCVRFDKVTAEFDHKHFKADSLDEPTEMFLKLRECYELDKKTKKILKSA